jgi:hypothetical protein
MVIAYPSIGRRCYGSGKTVLGCLSGLVVNAILSAQGGDLPTKPNFDRYKEMLEHSPFAVATAVVAPVATPNFAKDLYVANAARSSDGDMVTIASASDKDFKKYLTTKAAVDGYAIVSIKWSNKVGRTKVMISKDGQSATLRFNKMLKAQPLPNGSTGVFQESGFQRPAAFPTPTPHIHGLIQRSAQGIPPPGQE